MWENYYGESADKIFKEAREELSRSGGKTLIFESNSPEIIITAAVSGEMRGNYPHVGITARHGFSASFAFTDTGYDSLKWYNIDCYNSENGRCSFKILMQNYSVTDVKKRSYLLCVYFPVLSCVSEMNIGIKKGCLIKADSRMENSGKIVMLGSKNTFGIGVTSSAFIQSNILLRRLGREVFNLGLTFFNIYDECMLPLVHALKPQTVILEADPPRSDKKITKEKLPVYLKELSRYNVIAAMNPNSFDAGIYEILRGGLKENSVLLKSSDIFTDEELPKAQYNSNFFNDAGNALMALKLISTINENGL